jgi:serine/threonine-protein kinase RsbW
MPLEIEADLGKLKSIREYVTESATALGVRPTALDDLCLAVDEAVTNILTHGYDGTGEISLELAAAGPDIVVCLRDQAPTFDPALAPAVDLTPPGERGNPGGFGVYLMQSVMDEITHRQLDTGNELTMIKRNVVSSGFRGQFT